MRRIVHRAAVGLCLLVVALVALGAAPSALGSGDPYHLVVTEAESTGAAALRAPDGRSSGYRTGPVGLKESFTHSPFDEVSALVARAPGAAVEGREHAVRITVDGSRYRAEVRR